jgi:hypothetical protein
MYGKLFASTFTGSLCGSGPTVFAVWSYVIAHAVDSSVELNPRLLAGVLGTDAKEVANAIEFLGRPDPDSRNADQGGRRLIREGQYQYRVVSHSIYRAIKSDENRRAYNREKQRESRERRGKADSVKLDIIDSQTLSMTNGLSIRNVNDGQDNTDTNTGTDPKAVRTQDRSTYRTSDTSLMSTATETKVAAVNENHVPQGYSRGPAEMGALQRDHLKHVVCSYVNIDLCVGVKLFETLWGIYNTPDRNEAVAAVERWLKQLEDRFRTGGKSPGGFTWMVKEFRAWLVIEGRVPENTKPTKQSRTPEQIKADVRAHQEAQAKKKAAKR